MSNLELPSRSLPAVITEAIACVSLNITSIIGNRLVCIAAYRNTNLRSTTNLYIIALAVSDLLCETADMAWASATLIIGRWAFGNALCQFQGFINMFTSNVIPVTLGLTAINRYVKIVKISHYKKIFSPRNHQPVYHCFSCQRSAVWNSTDAVNFCHADHRKMGLWRRPMPIWRLCFRIYLLCYPSNPWFDSV